MEAHHRGLAERDDHPHRHFILHKQYQPYHCNRRRRQGRGPAAKQSPPNTGLGLDFGTGFSLFDQQGD
jgi:hypothetical protein